MDKLNNNFLLFYLSEYVVWSNKTDVDLNCCNQIVFKLFEWNNATTQTSCVWSEDKVKYEVKLSLALNETYM